MDAGILEMRPMLSWRGVVGTNIRSLADLALLNPVGGSDRPDHRAPI